MYTHFCIIISKHVRLAVNSAACSSSNMGFTFLYNFYSRNFSLQRVTKRIKLEMHAGTPILRGFSRKVSGALKDCICCLSSFNKNQKSRHIWLNLSYKMFMKYLPEFFELPHVGRSKRYGKANLTDSLFQLFVGNTPKCEHSSFRVVALISQ